MSDHSGPHRAADPGAALIASPGGKRKGVTKMCRSKVEMSPLSKVERRHSRHERGERFAKAPFLRLGHGPSLPKC